jgi:hypothetical protein
MYFCCMCRDYRAVVLAVVVHNASYNAAVYLASRCRPYHKSAAVIKDPRIIVFSLFILL